MSQAELNARYAAKLAHRRANPDKVQTYPANRGAGLIAEISDLDARYAAKLAARVEATRNDQAEKAAPKGEAIKAEASAHDKHRAQRGDVDKGR